MVEQMGIGAQSADGLCLWITVHACRGRHERPTNPRRSNSCIRYSVIHLFIDDCDTNQYLIIADKENKMSNGFFTRSEIASQPTVWKKTLQKMNVQRDVLAGSLAGLTNRAWIVTGCGSTYYLSLHAASV